MSALTAAARGRAAAEALMTDTITITRITGYTLNPSTGVNTPTTLTIYTGKCRVRAPSSPSGYATEAGETWVPNVAATVALPVTVTTVNEGDRGTVNTSNDPDLVGKVLLVRTVRAGTHITARRLLCQEMPDS